MKLFITKTFSGHRWLNIEGEIILDKFKKCMLRKKKKCNVTQKIHEKMVRGHCPQAVSAATK